MEYEDEFQELHRSLDGLNQKYPGVERTVRTTSGLMVRLRSVRSLPDYKERGDPRICFEVADKVIAIFGDDAKHLNMKYEAFTEGDAIKIKIPE
jgi:hypothetical protein